MHVYMQFTLQPTHSRIVAYIFYMQKSFPYMFLYTAGGTSS